MATASLFLMFFVLLLLNVPIAISLAVSSVTVLAATTDFSLYMIAQRMFSALDSNTLMAVPGFVFAGVIMAHGGISHRLIEALRSWVGHLRGGLSVVTILACMLFAAISGSSPATAAAIGGILIPAMVRGGYKKEYAMGLVAASGTLGILIPPSISFVLFGVTAEESIGQLFMAGVLPGVLLGGSLILVAIIIAIKNNYGGEVKVSLGERMKATYVAIPGLCMPFLILGSIYGGVATPTESSIVAVFYSLFVAFFVYKELNWEKFREILSEAIGISSMIFLIVAAAMTFGLYLTSEQVPQKVVEWVIKTDLGVGSFWIVSQLMFFVMGTFLEAISIILITVPILMPIVELLHINPIHFAVVMVVNMELAMITPPVGLNLFVVSGIVKGRLEEAVRGVFPFLAMMVFILVMLVLFPGISLYLPDIMK